MKKFSTIIIAMALVLGLGQCKKQETPATTDPEDGLVYITVNVGDNGAKHEVYPNTGAYVFENNDVLYVGNNGHYIGTLTYNDGAFSGTIDSPSTTDYLHFFFVSGLGPTAEELEEASDPVTSFNVDISDQSSKLPILSYGQSTQKYTDANATYSTILRNKCGLVKFVPATPTSKPIIVGGMKTTATINFAGSVAPTGATGAINLYSESNAVKWAVLLEQSEVTSPTVTISGFEATITKVPTITNNYYNSNGVGISMTAACPTGTINGLFTVNAYGKQVWFAQGNLQYNKTTNEWSFMEYQYDMVETYQQNVGTNYAYQNIVSLFGWGTSGYQHGATAYQPYSTNTDASYYAAYGISTYNLYDQTGKADWGYNAIKNGGNTVNSGWRTLTKDEWGYVFQSRDNAASKYGLSIVNGVKGMVLLPDDWTLPEGLSFTSGYTDWANNYTIMDWALMEAKGAVFLPAACQREGTVISTGNTDNDVDNGYYWSSSYNTENSGRAHYVRFTINKFGPMNHYPKYYGRSVRLVRDMPNP